MLLQPKLDGGLQSNLMLTIQESSCVITANEIGLTKIIRRVLQFEANSDVKC